MQGKQGQTVLWAPEIHFEYYRGMINLLCNVRNKMNIVVGFPYAQWGELKSLLESYFFLFPTTTTFWFQGDRCLSALEYTLSLFRYCCWSEMILSIYSTSGVMCPALGLLLWETPCSCRESSQGPQRWWRDLEAQGGSYQCVQTPEGRVQGRWSQTLQCCPMAGQEAVGTNWNTETHKVSSNLQETFFFFFLTGTVCLERLWILPSLLEILRSCGAGQASLGVPTCADVILIVSFLARHALFELSYVWACGFAFLCHPP